MAGGLNIVLVEDQMDFRQLLVRVLESRGHVVQAYDSVEAMQESATAMQAELFILDVNLPGEDGLSLTRRLRAQSPLVNIVLVTARTGPQDRGQGYDVGADVYLTKPVEVAELLAVLRRFVQRKRGSAAQPDLPSTLRLQRRRLTGDLGEVLLTHDETLLLTALVRAPGGKLTTWQLAELLASEPSERFQSSLVVRMVRLRKKLSQAGGGGQGQPIESVRGVGYQLLTHIILV